MFDVCLSSFRFHTLGSSPCVAIISVGVAGKMVVSTVLVRTSSISLFIPTLFGLCRRRAVRPLSVLWAICSPVLLGSTYKTGVVRRRRTAPSARRHEGARPLARRGQRHAALLARAVGVAERLWGVLRREHRRRRPRPPPDADGAELIPKPYTERPSALSWLPRAQDHT